MGPAGNVMVGGAGALGARNAPASGRYVTAGVAN